MFANSVSIRLVLDEVVFIFGQRFDASRPARVTLVLVMLAPRARSFLGSLTSDFAKRSIETGDEIDALADEFEVLPGNGTADTSAWPEARRVSMMRATHADSEAEMIFFRFSPDDLDILKRERRRALLHPVVRVDCSLGLLAYLVRRLQAFDAQLGPREIPVDE